MKVPHGAFQHNAVMKVLHGCSDQLKKFPVTGQCSLSGYKK